MSFSRSYGDESSNRTLVVGSAQFPAEFEKCAAEKPVTCDRPGAAAEILKLLSNYYHAQMDLVDFKGFGIGYPAEGNTTIMRSLVDGRIQLGGPSVMYISERVNNLPNFSFPINMESLCAVMIANSSLIRSDPVDSIDVVRQGPLWGVIVFIGVITYYWNYLMDRYVTDHMKVSKHFLAISTLLVNLLFYALFNFTSSVISIVLFRVPPTRLPFKTFDEMADQVVSGTITLVGIQSSGPTKFITPSLEMAQADSTLMKFYKANEAGRIMGVPTMDDAMALLAKEENRAFIINLFAAKSVTNLCDYVIITDSTFPKIPYGFFYSNTTPAWFNPTSDKMAHLGLFYEYYLKNYVYPTRCLSVLPRQGLNIKQLQTLFAMVPCAFAIAFASLLWEFVHAPKDKEEQRDQVETRAIPTFLTLEKPIEKPIKVSQQPPRQEWEYPGYSPAFDNRNGTVFRQLIEDHDVHHIINVSSDEMLVLKKLKK